MQSDDIRAQIAALEAESERRQQAQTPRADPGEEPDPWQRLFDTPWFDPDELAARRSEAEFSLNAWLAEGLRGLRGGLRAVGLDDEFWGHIHGAERELLLAARALVDARLRRLERTPPTPEARLQKIEVEF